MILFAHKLITHTHCGLVRVVDLEILEDFLPYALYLGGKCSPLFKNSFFLESPVYFTRILAHDALQRYWTPREINLQ